MPNNINAGATSFRVMTDLIPVDCLDLGHDRDSCVLKVGIQDWKSWPAHEGYGSRLCLKFKILRL
jgi:hypothetical protein